MTATEKEGTWGSGKRNTDAGADEGEEGRAGQLRTSQQVGQVQVSLTPSSGGSPNSVLRPF